MALPYEAVCQMLREMDDIAAQIYPPPDSTWEENFQARWLWEEYGVTGMEDEEGYTWGVRIS